MWDASCENQNFSLKKESFKSSFRAAQSPEWHFFPPELVVQVVFVTSPDISLLYKLTSAATGLESERILLKEWWMYFASLLCHLSSPNDHFHVKRLILSFSPPSAFPPLPSVYFLCLHLVKTHHPSLWLCIYLSYSHLKVIELLTVNICNKIYSKCPPNCALEKLWLGETGRGNRLHSGWWPSWKRIRGSLSLISWPQPASPAARFTQKFKHQLCPQNITWFCFAELSVKLLELQSVNGVGNWSIQHYWWLIFQVEVEEDLCFKMELCSWLNMI